MECLVCKNNIDAGSHVFRLSEMVYCADECFSYSHTMDSKKDSVIIHISCLSMLENNKLPQPDVVEYETEKEISKQFVVQRSDALSMFDL